MAINIWQHLAWAQYLAAKLDCQSDDSLSEGRSIDEIYTELSQRNLLPLNASEEDVKEALKTLAELPEKLILPNDDVFKSWTSLREYKGSDAATVDDFRAALYSGEEDKIGVVSAKVRQLVSLLRSSKKQGSLLSDIAAGAKIALSPEEANEIVDSFLIHAQLQHSALDYILAPSTTSETRAYTPGFWLDPPLKGQYPDYFLLTSSYLLPVTAADAVSDPYAHLRLQLTEATAFRFISRALLRIGSPKSAADSSTPDSLLNTFRLAADKRDVLLLRFLSFVFPNIVSAAPNLEEQDIARLVMLFSDPSPPSTVEPDPAAPPTTLPPSSSLAAAAAPTTGDTEHFVKLLQEAKVKVEIENAGKSTSDDLLDFVARTMNVSKHTISTLAWLLCQGAEFPPSTPVVDACNVFLSLDLDTEEAIAYFNALATNTRWITLYAEKGGSTADLAAKIQLYQTAIAASTNKDDMIHRLAAFVSAVLLELISVGNTEYVEDLHYTASSRGDPELEEMVKMSGKFLRIIQESKGITPVTPPKWSWKDAAPFIAPAVVALLAVPMLGPAAGVIAAVLASTWGVVKLVQKGTTALKARAAEWEHFASARTQLIHLIDPLYTKATGNGSSVERSVRREFIPPAAVPAPTPDVSVSARSAPMITVNPDMVIFFVTCLEVKRDADGKLVGYTNQPSTQDGDLILTFGRVSLSGSGDNDTLFAAVKEWNDMKLGRPPPDSLSWISLEEDDFWSQVKASEQSVVGGETLILTHGYNVSYTNGVMSAMILRKKMTHKGPIILFNWPSRAQTAAYLIDLGQIARTVDPLVRVLKRIDQQSERVLLVGHSMGCELSTRAVSDDKLTVKQPSEAIAQQLKSRVANKDKGISAEKWRNVVELGTTRLTTDLRKKCHQFAFAAADVDFEDFVQRAKKMATKGVVTLYCSEDRALLASRSLRLMKLFRFRAGDRACLSSTRYYHMYDTIDTDHEGVDPIQHSWIFRGTLAAPDVGLTFAGAVPPRKEVAAEFVRRLTEKDGKADGDVSKTEYFELRAPPK